MPPVALVWYDGGLRPPRPAELENDRKLGDSGVIYIGDKGTMMEGRIIPESKMKETNLPPKTIPRINGTHEQNWIDACTGGPPACANFDYAGPLSEVVLLGNFAIRLNQKLMWDGPNMKVTNVPEANEFVGRQYRQGWAL